MGTFCSKVKIKKNDTENDENQRINANAKQSYTENVESTQNQQEQTTTAVNRRSVGNSSALKKEDEEDTNNISSQNIEYQKWAALKQRNMSSN
eukprot:c8688_g1_i1.p1 GENE.c8688_g1_i1~~c8688_g1_i1.p1  ORF type:complete len:106 (-),score=29.89 c8688_g1_i1:228-506(-)